MDQVELQEQIERYLAQQMSLAEKSAFELKLQQDADLAEKVELEREVNAAIEDSTGLALEKDLQMIGDEFVEKYTNQETATVKPLRSNRRRWWLAAASILLLASFWFLKDAFLKPDAGQLYAQVYEPYIATKTTRSLDPTQANAFNQALTFYQEGTYQEAFLGFEKLAQNNLSKDDRLELQFYQGLAQMALENIDQAMPYFQLLVQENNNLYVQQSKWYLALCHLKQGSPEKTKSLLREIIEQSKRGKYFHLAEALLKELS